MTQKKMDHWAENIDKLSEVMSTEEYRNYQRNKKLIDLSETPENVTKDIINNFMSQDPRTNKGKVFPYLVEKRCRLLVEVVEEFF